MRRLFHPSAAELTRLAALDQEAFGSPGLRECDLALMAHAGLLLVAEEDKELVGGCQLMRMVDDPGLLWVVGFYIVPARRGQGRGAEFLQLLIDRLPQWGARGLALTVHPDNTEAVGLYRRFGFRLVDSVAEFYGAGEERELLVLDPGTRPAAQRIVGEAPGELRCRRE